MFSLAMIHSLRPSELYWRYLGNWKPSLLHRLFPPALDQVQRELLDQLRRRGIAMTTVEQLGLQGAFAELEDWVRCYDAAMASDLARRRERAEDPGFKTYLIQLLGKQYQLVWPEAAANAKLQWPMSGWTQ